MDELTPEERDVVARARAAWIMGDAEAAGRILDEYAAHHPERREALLAHRDAAIEPPPPASPSPPSQEPAAHAASEHAPDPEPWSASRVASRAFAAAGIGVVLAAGGCGLAALTIEGPLFYPFFLVGWLGIIGAPIALVVAILAGLMALAQGLRR